MSTGIKKNPVSRPVRHLGPPPGFGSVPSKVMDESSSAMTVKNEHTLPLMDGYSWLDGYQLSSSQQSIGFNNSVNHSTQNYLSLSKSSNSVGMVSFPFPGKQEQPQQLRSVNQQSAALPQQHQGQPLWECPFFV
ncbi:hypothetical protein P3S67_007718 [Capsicum chacoense]